MSEPSSSMARRRAWRGPAVLSLGLRPFFFAGAVFGAAAIPAWILGFLYGQAAYGALSAADWHAHEMVFGFLSAVIAGFLLTAVPNWTGRLPVAGWPLAGLAGLWLLGRLAALAPLPPGATATLTLLFPVAVTLLTAREVAAGKNWRNLPVVGLVGLLALGDGLFWASWWGADSLRDVGLRLGLAATAMLIVLIGGRIVPSFTRNWLAQQGEKSRFPRPFGRIDKAAMLSAGLAWAAWVIAPEHRVFGGVMLIAAAIQAWRLAGWRGGATLAEPLVAVLHVGYGWLVFAMALLAAAALAPTQIPPSAALHALSAGAAPMMILAVMTRASRGHTGRALSAGGQEIAIYGLVSLGALIRTLGPIVAEDWLATAAIGGGLWTLGMLGFALVYGPMLLRPRAA